MTDDDRMSYNRSSSVSAYSRSFPNDNPSKMDVSYIQSEDGGGDCNFECPSLMSKRCSISTNSDEEDDEDDFNSVAFPHLRGEEDLTLVGSSSRQSDPPPSAPSKTLMETNMNLELATSPSHLRRYSIGPPISYNRSQPLDLSYKSLPDCGGGTFRSFPYTSDSSTNPITTVNKVGSHTRIQRNDESSSKFVANRDINTLRRPSGVSSSSREAVTTPNQRIHSTASTHSRASMQLSYSRHF